jgi:hypothetical protein
MATDGITRLISVTQQKAANANEEALGGAEKQKSLIDKQQTLRAAQSSFDALSKDSSVTGTEQGIKANARAVRSEATIAKPADYLGRYAKSGFGASSRFSPTELSKNLATVASNATRFASGIGSFIDGLKKVFENANKGLEPQDKLDNFAIQDLMSSYNEAVSLASSMKKKTDDQNSSVIGKI